MTDLGHIYIFMLQLPNGEQCYRGAFLDQGSAERAAVASTRHIKTVGPLGVGTLPPDELQPHSAHRNKRTGPIVWSAKLTFEREKVPHHLQKSPGNPWTGFSSRPVPKYEVVDAYIFIRKSPIQGSPLHALAEQAE